MLHCQHRRVGCRALNPVMASRMERHGESRSAQDSIIEDNINRMQSINAQYDPEDIFKCR